MKKQISWRLCVIIVMTMLFTLAVNFGLQARNARMSMIHASQLKIHQVEKTLKNNEEEIERLRQSLNDDYIIRAKAAAYILENHPEIAADTAEIKKTAALLQVDELHIFDQNGYLYAGSEPQYFGFTFDSGEQMHFFKRMLYDKSLELVQVVTPNTAEGKSMKYAAVWQENGENIIQIGMEPVRLLEALKKNELPYIFSMATPEEGSILFAADKETGVISGATYAELNGKTLAEIGIFPSGVPRIGEGFRATVSGTPGYVYVEEWGDQYIGAAQADAIVYRNLPKSMMRVSIYLTLISCILIFTIMHQIDRHVIQGVDVMIEKLEEITGGNLETEVHIAENPEFRKLSVHINRMVASLLRETEKISAIFEAADVQVGFYEYNDKMKRVRATKKVGVLLMLTAQERNQLFADKERFAQTLDQVCTNPLEGYKDIYRLPGDAEVYLKIQKFSEEGKSLGVITDVTEEVLERRQLEYDRDYDLLTVLLNRRGFYRQMGLLFGAEKSFRHAVMLMLDMNRLKYVNDNFGHACGDLAIQAAAGVLKACPAPNKVMARLSGDEFVLFLYGDSREELQDYIDRTHEQMLKTEAELLGGERLQVRMSGGYLFYPEYDVGYSRMLRLADQAMYRAKKAGKAEFLPYDPVLDAERPKQEGH